MKRPSHNAGFVLVLVLLVVFIAGAALATTARTSCGRALDAGDALQQLQLRWGSRSCQAAYLPRAEQMLMDRDRDGVYDTPAATARRTVTLGAMTFHLIFSDEQAKANVNLIAAQQGKQALRHSLRTLQADQRRLLRVRLKPAAAKARAFGPAPPIYTSFDQLFEFEHPSELVGIDTLRPPASARITCWGDGRVNFKRAERAVLRQSLAGLLDETSLDTLIRLRRESPDCTLAEAIKHLALPRKKAREVRRYLTDRSRSHGLWVIAEGPTRKWYRLYVAAPNASYLGRQQWSFTW